MDNYFSNLFYLFCFLFILKKNILYYYLYYMNFNTLLNIIKKYLSYLDSIIYKIITNMDPYIEHPWKYAIIQIDNN